MRLLALVVLAVSVHACCALQPSRTSESDQASLSPSSSDLRYDPTWDSLDSRPLPSWYDEAKFGIFVNWGVYSVPAFAKVGNYAEWYWNTLVRNDDGETVAFHERVYGKDFSFQDFAPLFKAELFNATEWAELFARSGARYIVPSSKHHDGFTMWPSQQSWNWNSVDVGPHRDLLLETLTAARQVGLRAGIYFSLFAWFHPLYLRDPALYVEQVMYPQWMDLIDNYQPDVLWCDGDWEQNSTLWRATDFLAYLYNDSPVKDSIVVNDRFGSDARGHHGGFLTSEYSSTVYERKWEENSGIDIFSFGLNRQTPVEKYYTAAYLINLLLRTVSNGGNFLLNVGPRSDGTIPTIMQERLLQIGDWLSVNGEGIYGSSRWKVAQEGQIDNTTVRYTQSKDGSVIFAFVLDWPEDNRVTLRAVNWSSENASVTLLGWTASRLVWSKLSGGGGILVSLPYVTPSTLPCMYAWTLKLLGFSG